LIANFEEISEFDGMPSWVHRLRIRERMGAGLGVGFALVIAGCLGEPPVPGGGDGGGSSPGTSTATDASSSSTAPADDTHADTTASETGASFVPVPDMGTHVIECDIFTQDCPPGEKCMLVGPSGSHLDLLCMPIAEDPAGPGEPCTRTGDRWSGIDTCALGSLCWAVDPETHEGVCYAFCIGNVNSLYCQDPNATCSFSNSPPYALCVVPCNPLLQDCPAGQACYPVRDSWACVVDASGDAGAYGDACEYVNACDPGLFCLNASWAPPGLPCEGAVGCCTEVCDLTDPLGDLQCAGAAEGETCQAWYEEGTAPPNLEDVGACALPQ
jgi:hypothetical protein